MLALAALVPRALGGRATHRIRNPVHVLVRCCSAASPPAAKGDPRDAVVKIFNARQRPGWTVPWQMQPVESSSGSGAVISWEGKAFVLTAAHVVADTRYLQIQRSMDRFNSEKFPARVAAICHEVDLALLSVDDDEALSTIEPLKLAAADALPLVFDKVHVVGYPVGGDAVSVTEGVVSRVEVQEYSHSLRAGLALTVDAAINSGNSGGPLLDAATSNIVGVAFQKLVARGVELQGHAVPAPLIHRFLKEVEASVISRGSSSDAREEVPTLTLRMPSLGCDYQSLEPPALRQALGLGDKYHGVLVNRLHYSCEAPALLAGDVLISFDGLDLDDHGFCYIFGRRLHFAAARDLRATGMRLPLSIYRNGHVLTVEHQLNPSEHFVPRGQYDCVPQYFACGGLVFQPLNQEYLGGWNPSERPTHLQNLFSSGHTTPERTEAVMLSQVLADAANAGYDSGWIGAPIVRKVNGIAIRDLGHLVEIVRKSRQEAAKTGTEAFLQFGMEMASGPYHIVLSVASLADADARVQKLYGVPEVGCSPHYVSDSSLVE